MNETPLKEPAVERDPLDEIEVLCKLARAIAVNSGNTAVVHILDMAILEIREQAAKTRQPSQLKPPKARVARGEQ